MDGFVSLKRDDRENEQPMPPSPEPEYPGGTQLRIEGDTIDELGLDNVRRGDKVRIEAYAYVSGVESRDGDGVEGYRCVTLQPTEIKVEPDADGEREAEKYDRLDALLSPTG